MIRSCENCADNGICSSRLNEKCGVWSPQLSDFEKLEKENLKNVRPYNDISIKAVFQAGYDTAMQEVEARRCEDCGYNNGSSMVEKHKCLGCFRFGDLRLSDNFKKKCKP